ncbi:MAG: 5-amino-6-(D-ribitylamino)uracil--L-tyrosine 4-hydroxyphenyl transferase CofH [Steroidobacteraceae bacterium]
MQRDEELRQLLRAESLGNLLAEAVHQRDLAHDRIVSYSRKVFVPLTRLCRDQCHYCTFATAPRNLPRPYLTPEEVLAIARAGERAGCHEVLFTLGDKPELRYGAAREHLRELGHATTISYLAAMCELVNRETSLLVHVNPGVTTAAELAQLRVVSVSQGIMLETLADRLCVKGMPHYGSPDKVPAVRLGNIRLAGELAIPFTSGILIGIGETREERIDALLALRDLHERHGHLQEIIVQNFRGKTDTRMAGAPEPDLDDLMWTVAAARLVFGPAMNIQAPPNLSPEEYPLLLAAGINDWGGVSPVTPDHVNPEMPWPQIEVLRARTAAAGRTLVERLPVYPEFATAGRRWLDAGQMTRVLRAMDASGYARTDGWSPGVTGPIPVVARIGAPARTPAAAVTRSIERARAGEELAEAEIVRLFEARDEDFHAVCTAADDLRRETASDVVRYVVNRNINYTNVCAYRCSFCAFSKSTKANSLRGPAYDLDFAEIQRRVREAWDRGATEVCMQGGIHPDYTGETYLSLLGAVKEAVPGMHVHAFSPLEVTHGATTLGLPLEDYLRRLQAAGLGSLPGTAAEILDDDMRAVLCPDKVDTAEWLDVVGTAHRVGLRTTATIMFGHIESPLHWARHLLAIRRLQARTGGFTEFVPLPFVHMEAPLYFKGLARKGPTFRETVLMHAIARLALHPVLPNVQVSWVKLGEEGVRACLRAGANDLGGTLMNESISRAAGTQNGQEWCPAQMDRLVQSLGRTPMQRTTLYGAVPGDRRELSYAASALTSLVLTPAGKRAQSGSAAARAAGCAT